MALKLIQFVKKTKSWHFMFKTTISKHSKSWIYIFFIISQGDISILIFLKSVVWTFFNIFFKFFFLKKLIFYILKIKFHFINFSDNVFSTLIKLTQEFDEPYRASLFQQQVTPPLSRGKLDAQPQTQIFKLPTKAFIY